MIGWLQGHIIDSPHPGKLILNVQGVGYDVETSLQTYFKLEGYKDAVRLHIQTIVREDAFLLYGFLEKEERQLFRALIKVNGVGPKSAMAILSAINPADFICSIQEENTAYLTRLPGIGKKTAERLVIEMRDSIKEFTPQATLNRSSSSAALNHQEEAIAALEALGYKRHEVAKLIAKLDDGSKRAEELIRQALQNLAKV